MNKKDKDQLVKKAHEFAAEYKKFSKEAYNAAKAKAKKWIMGVPFRPMEALDFQGFQGASEGDLIGFPSDDVVLIYSPDSKELHEVWDGGERLWKEVY